MKKFILITVLLALAICLSAQLVHPEAVAIRQGANIEWYRSSASINEGVVYVWSDTRAGGRDLFAQLISPTGQKLWSNEFTSCLIVDNKPDRQEDPMIIASSDNHVIIAWVDFTADPKGDIWANKISPAGVKLWGTDGSGIAVCTAEGEQISINMVPDNAGGAYIAWTDDRSNPVQIFMQHVNSSGVASWAVNGINISNTTYNKGSNTFWEDEEGGAVMAFVESRGQGDHTSICIMRFHYDPDIATLSEGVVWGPHDISDQESPSIDHQKNPKMAPDGAGGFIFVWEYRDPTIGGRIRLKGQRIDLDGTKIWDPTGFGINITGDYEVTSSQERHRVVEVGSSFGGGAIVAWEDKRGDNSTSDIYIQRFNTSGLPQWAPNSGVPVHVAAGEKIENLRMTKTNDGGAAIVWEDPRNIGENQPQIFAQRVLHDGTFAWDATGKIMSNTVGGQEGGNIKLVGADQYAIVWADMRTGSLALMTQIVNPDGTNVLDANGEIIYYGLSGNADYFVSRVHGDFTYIVWEDSRHGSVFGSKIYYQIVNASGAEVVPHNGNRVSLCVDPPNIYERNMSAEINPNGDMCIVWTRNVDGIETFFAQIINSSGARLLGPNGVQLRENGSSQGQAYILWRNNGWEIYWSEMSIANGKEVYGQRLEGTTLAWGDSARQVVACDLGLEFFGILHSLEFAKGDYIIIHRMDTESNTVNTKNLVKLGADGLPLASWGTFGVPITDFSVEEGEEPDPNAPNFMFSNLNIFETSDRIVVFWSEKIMASGLDSCIYVAIFDHNGVPQLSDKYINLIPTELDQVNVDIYQTGNVFTVTFLQQLPGEAEQNRWKNKSIRFSVNSSTENPISHLWNDQGVLILPDETDPIALHYAASTTLMGSSHISIFTKIGEQEEYMSLYLSGLHSNGTSANANPSGFLICDHEKDQKAPIIHSHTPNLATVVWIDAISSGKDAIYGIYLNRVNLTSISEIDDTVNTPSIFSRVGNFPNPFNPETTISFDLNFSADVQIDIFNIKGQKVKSLVNGTFEKGRNEVIWNGVNNSGKSVASGLYFYQIKSGEETITRKMMLLK
jgi:hypothetical protein